MVIVKSSETLVCSSTPEAEAEQDEEAGLGHAGGESGQPVEAELGQAADEDEHYNGQVVLHQAPLPPNQTEQEYVDISFVNVSVS